jgi:hypothetical protein
VNCSVAPQVQKEKNAIAILILFNRWMRTGLSSSVIVSYRQPFQSAIGQWHAVHQQMMPDPCHNFHIVLYRGISAVALFRGLVHDDPRAVDKRISLWTFSTKMCVTCFCYKVIAPRPLHGWLLMYCWMKVMSGERTLISSFCCWVMCRVFPSAAD